MLIELREDENVFSKKSTYTWLVFGYAAFILILSSIPDLSPPKLGFKFQDKLYHLIEYSILSILLFLALINSSIDLFRKNILIFALLIGTALAAVDEIHQNLIPGRSADTLDFAADFLGLALVQVGCWIFYRKRDVLD